MSRRDGAGALWWTSTHSRLEGPPAMTETPNPYSLGNMGMSPEDALYSDQILAVVAAADSDGDKRIDIMAYDRDGDGVSDKFTLDTDGDGKADTLALDRDFDGRVDFIGLDRDGDGFL